MRTLSRLFLASTALAIAATGCSGNRMCPEVAFAPGANGVAAGPAASGGTDPGRAIAEADIVALGQSWLYALSNSGSLAIVDVSKPGNLALLGSTTLPGQPFEMYEQGSVVLAMVNGAVDSSGKPVPAPAPDATGAGGAAAQTPDPRSSAALLAIDVHDPAHVTTLGSTTLTLPRQEGLRTVRFDGPRAYAITFNQTDPLFAIDLSDPKTPKQRGQLQMPGWMFYLEPAGTRVIGLGVDRTDPEGSLNVSLFDVSNMDSPTMLQRVAFGAADLGGDYAILNYELPEDQDRIQKAFRVFADGTVAVPYSAAGGYAQSACANPASGIQLVRWTNDTLAKAQLLPVSGNPRRALEKSGQILAVSDSDVASFSLATPGSKGTPATPTAHVTIGTCVPKQVPGMGGGVGDGPRPGLQVPVSGGCG